MIKAKNLLYALLMGGTLLFAATACSSDDDTAASSAEITIVSSDLLFEPLGRTGSVEVLSSGPVTADLPAEWATAEVEGSLVRVTVQDNTDFEGRSAVLTIHANGTQRQLPVQQRGMALGTLAVTSYHAANAGGRTAFYIRHDLPLELSVDEDWIHASTQGDSLIIETDANTARQVRRGTVTYACGPYESQLDIAQYDKSEVLGQYYMGGEMSGGATGFRFHLVERDGGYYMNFFTSETWKDDYIPVGFDEGRCEIKFYSASVIHRESSSRYDMFYLYYRTEEGGITLTTSDQAYMSASLYFNPFWGSHYGSLEGAWGDHQITGFIIRATYPFVGTSTFIQLDNPYLVWLGPIDS